MMMFKGDVHYSIYAIFTKKEKDEWGDIIILYIRTSLIHLSNCSLKLTSSRNTAVAVL